MKKILFAIVSFSVMANSYGQSSTEYYHALLSQKSDTTKFEDRLYYGGNVGLSFGSYSHIEFYPLVGYKITPKFSAGLKTNFQYIKDDRFNRTYSISNYGGSLFARFRVIPQIYTHSEFKVMNYKLYNSVGEDYRTWFPFLYIGIGCSQIIADNTWLDVQALFDVWKHKKKPYGRWKPVYNVGIIIGF